jgi:hypothetical protein
MDWWHARGGLELPELAVGEEADACQWSMPHGEHRGQIWQACFSTSRAAAASRQGRAIEPENVWVTASASSDGAQPLRSSIAGDDELVRVGVLATRGTRDFRRAPTAANLNICWTCWLAGVEEAVRPHR